MRRWNYFIEILCIIVLDGISILLAFLSAYWLRAGSGLFDITRVTPFYPYQDLIPFVLILTLFSLYFCKIYHQIRSPILDQIPSLFLGSLLAFAILIIATFLFKMYPYSRILLLLFFILNFIYLFLNRLLVRYIRIQLWKKGLGLTRAVIMGENRILAELIHALSPPELSGYQIIGFIHDKPMELKQSDIPINRLGSLSEFDDIILKNPVDEIFIIQPESAADRLTHWLFQCSEKGIRINLIPHWHEILFHHAIFKEFRGIPVITLQEPVYYFWNKFWKRILDIIISLTGLIITLPLTIPIALLIRFDRQSPGSVFYIQIRLGKNGIPFRMYKFRSMIIDADKQIEKFKEQNIARGPLFKIPSDPRITRCGHFLRKWSLDELPQLINVLKNEMSLVGPRPPLPNEFEQYENWQKKRLDIKPGMTGLWQISGRSDLSFDDMVKLDIYYIEHWSLWLDIKILIKTVLTVLQGKGAY